MTKLANAVIEAAGTGNESDKMNHATARRVILALADNLSDGAVAKALDALDVRWRNPHGDPDWEKRRMRAAIVAALKHEAGEE